MNSASVEQQLVHGIVRKRETTEWQDALAKVNKQVLSPEEQALYDQQNVVYREQTIEPQPAAETKTLAEIDELLEDDDEDEELLRLKERRMQELMAQAARNKFREVRELTADEYKTEVTEASRECFVVVLLYKRGIADCDVLEARMNELAPKKRATKFVKILSYLAIPDYPDKLLPTLIVYRNTNHVKQFIGLAEFGGTQMTCDSLEWALSRVGAVETNLKKDPRDQKRRTKFTGGIFAREGGRSESDDDDSDD